MSIRAQAVEMARAQGLCTQCLKHKVAPHRYQCQRCIDTNRRKWRNTMATKPKGKSKEELIEQRRKKNADRARLAYHERRAAQGFVSKTHGPMSEEDKVKIRSGIAQSQARRAAFGLKDTEAMPRRHYRKHIPVSPVQMAGMVADLENFIHGVRMMNALDYLEAREELIINIIKRGGKNGDI